MQVCFTGLPMNWSDCDFLGSLCYTCSFDSDKEVQKMIGSVWIAAVLMPCSVVRSLLLLIQQRVGWSSPPSGNPTCGNINSTSSSPKFGGIMRTRHKTVYDLPLLYLEILSPCREWSGDAGSWRGHSYAVHRHAYMLHLEVLFPLSMYMTKKVLWW